MINVKIKECETSSEVERDEFKGACKVYAPASLSPGDHLTRREGWKWGNKRPVCGWWLADLRYTELGRTDNETTEPPCGNQAKYSR